MDKKFQNSYEVTQAHEIGVALGHKTVSVIYVQYSKGGLIAIPELNIYAESSSPTDMFDNALNLANNVYCSRKRAKIIAEAIREHWESV